MTGPTPPLAARQATLIACGVLGVAALAAYHNSFHGPLVFDDIPSIRDNPTIRHLGTSLQPPHGMTVDARPLLNLTLALNYAWSGLGVASYHYINLLIHFLAGLTLFGVVRRTLDRRVAAGGTMPGLLSPAAFGLAVAALWLLHPLQTEAVTYIIQRAESLVGLFYLLTLYCFIRSVEDTAGGGRWSWLTMFCCLCGMLTKEVMVTAPVIVLLYDSTFVTGSVAEAWRRRSRLYLALALTWLPVLILELHSPGRGGSSGPARGTVWAQYIATQFPVIVRYFRLSLWPSHLIFDYGPEPEPSGPVLLFTAIIVLSAAAAALAGLGRKPIWGFVAFWFFALLAPSTLVPGHLQMAAEHRVYLALAAVVVAVVAGLDWLAAKLAWRPALLVLPVLAAGLGVATSARNADYRTDLELWRDTVAKRAGNPYARVNLGIAEFQAGRPDVAAEHFAAAVKLKPEYGPAHSNLGATLIRLGRKTEARDEYAAAVKLNPDDPDAQTTLGNFLAEAGNWQAAWPHYAAALKGWPHVGTAHFRLAAALLITEQAEAAAREYAAGLELQDDADARNNLGVALLRLGRKTEAVAQFQLALRLRPGDPAAMKNLRDVAER